MKPEHYNIILEKFGKEKADKIFEQVLNYKEERKQEMIAEHERLERMVEKMIPKDELQDGKYYNGYRWRGDHVAMWDKKAEKFKCVNFTMGIFFLEDLEHFEDVKDTKFDGFIPFEEIKPIEVK